MSFDSSQPVESIASSLVQIGDRLVQVWPPMQTTSAVADPRMHATWFQDHDTIAAQATPLVLRAAESVKPIQRGAGGRKVRAAAVWDSPALRLLTSRALGIVCVTRGASVAHVVDRWANVMIHGEYSSAHSHYDSDLSVVYSLDAGDVIPLSGQLQIIDPRIPACCTSRAERPTRAIMPQMVSGAMIVFPAEFLHLVTPYDGQRPRITLAWNVSLGPPPANLPDPTLPYAGPIQRRGD